MDRLHPIVHFTPLQDKLLLLDLTKNNKDLTPELVASTTRFSTYISDRMAAANARYGIGGYDEHRDVYSRSEVFGISAKEEPRRLHLGIDIWGEEGTPVSAPLDGLVHSFAFNDQFGDYGATIILQHQFNGTVIHGLYGHLSLKDLDNLFGGRKIGAGEVFAHFGKPEENGHWPPHLHFQLIREMNGLQGDYPGVCKLSQRERYLANCPDPDLLLGMMQYATNTDSIL